MQYLLGINIQHNTLELGLYQENGDELPSGTGLLALDIPLPSPNTFEFSPELWWTTCIEGIKQLLQSTKIDSSDITVIGYSGFQDCPVFVDADGNSLRTVILPSDSKFANTQKDFPSLYQWYSKNDPDTLNKYHWLLAPKDFLRFKFTGQAHTDLSDASAMGLLDDSNNIWSPAKARALGIPMDKLPTLKFAHHAVGVITPEASEPTHLAMGTLVGAGAGELESSLLGMALVNPGDCGIILNRKASVSFVLPKYISPDNPAVRITHHVLPDQWLATISVDNATPDSITTAYKSLQSILQKDGIPLSGTIKISAENNSDQIKNIVRPLNQPVELYVRNQPATFGAALITGIACGVYLSFQDAFQQTIHPGTTITP